jgi:hypothetical protein
MSDSTSLLDDIFELLTLAEQLEEAGHSRIEAATKVRDYVVLLVYRVQQRDDTFFPLAE